MLRLFDMDTEQLKALAEYRDVLETGRFFTRNFWQKEKNISGIRLNCQVITRYCLEVVENVQLTALPTLNLKQIKDMLARNHLSGMIQTVFNNDVLEVLKNAYPEEFKKRQLTEWMWSKHGLWENDQYVIEAVQHMVLKEGIRRVDLIPCFDWKKRLLKYGIYNVLSRFNWSIFELFDFVYPGRFHPADFRYGKKWKTESKAASYTNAYRLMDKTFREKQVSRNEILTLNTPDFRKLGLVSMLLTVFDGRPFKAKELYLYKTQGNDENIQRLRKEIKEAHKIKADELILKRLSDISKGKYIYNLHSNNSVYSFLKRQANKRNCSIYELVKQFGFIYKTAREDQAVIEPEQIWDLRKKRLTYTEIAARLGSNPTTISEMCKKHFGGDPLIPRPVDSYITVQELMDKYRIDHKTIMKLVSQHKLENHMTIRRRYLKKSEIIPVILEYKKKSLQHQVLLNRYTGT